MMNFLPLYEYVTAFDCFLSAFYVGLVFLCVWIYKKTHFLNQSLSKHFSAGLWIKIGGGLIYFLIYAFYYGEGDVTSYFLCTRALVNLTFEDFGSTFQMLLGGNSLELRNSFTSATGVPYMYIFEDTKTWATCRFTYPFMMLAGKNILTTIILVDMFSFIGLWQFYLMLVRKYPTIKNKLFIVVFLIPSCLFWGSGISKDVFSFSSFLWILASIVNICDKKCNVLTNILLIIINSYIIICVKPYIFVALLFALFVILVSTYLRAIENKLLRKFVAPIIVIIVGLLSFFLYSLLSSSLGVYGNIDSAMTKAMVTQYDLATSDAYSDNRYNIGNFDVSFLGIIKKYPISLLYGAFSPFIWDSKSFFILLSAVESTILICTIFIMFFKSSFRLYWFKIKNDSFLLGSIFFLMLFLFFIGLTSANFGALVRYRIPALPLMWSLIIVLMDKHSNKVFYSEN